MGLKSSLDADFYHRGVSMIAFRATDEHVACEDVSKVGYDDYLLLLATPANCLCNHSILGLAGSTRTQPWNLQSLRTRLLPRLYRSGRRWSSHMIPSELCLSHG